MHQPLPPAQHPSLLSLGADLQKQRSFKRSMRLGRGRLSMAIGPLDHESVNGFTGGQQIAVGVGKRPRSQGKDGRTEDT